MEKLIAEIDELIGCTDQKAIQCGVVGCGT
jgi:hypothetical protein